jgi:hypothetical protein
MKTVGDILSYDGSDKDIALNYAAIVICGAPFLFLFFKLPLPEKQNWKRFLWFPIFLALSIFQVAFADIKLYIPRFIHSYRFLYVLSFCVVGFRLFGAL